MHQCDIELAQYIIIQHRILLIVTITSSKKKRPRFHRKTALIVLKVALGSIFNMMSI